MHAVARKVLPASALVALSLVFLGCSPAPEAPAPGAASEQPAPPARIPSPPGSRSIAASAEPGTLVVPLGPAGADGEVPSELVDGTIRRRLSVMGMEDDGSGLTAFYRAQIEANGYRVLFECDDLDACGGIGFVSSVVETFVTQPRSTRHASMVTLFLQPQTGFVRHFSLHRASAGQDHYVTVTAVRSDSGPVTVLTQLNDHAAEDRAGLE